MRVTLKVRVLQEYPEENPPDGGPCRAGLAQQPPGETSEMETQAASQMSSTVFMPGSHHFLSEGPGYFSKFQFPRCESELVSMCDTCSGSKARPTPCSPHGL